MSPEDKARFWGLTRMSNGGCLVWTGKRRSFGYGILNANGRSLRAHRVSWELAHGAIPSGMVVCHRCDNPPCVNPDHLFLGTQADNMRDCFRKNRIFRFAGFKASNHSCTKLSLNETDELRRLYATGWFRQMDLAEIFHVDQSSVSRVVRGDHWTAVHDQDQAQSSGVQRGGGE